LAINSFLEITVEKGIFDIELIDRSSLRNSQRQDHSNC
jgi:hypothetical protein